jgi:prepilin-type N-terminal cleavage/methylation domain-containing protein
MRTPLQLKFCDLAKNTSERVRVTSQLQLRGQSGFSLIELLIVMGIIVLVLAVATPAFQLLSNGRSVEAAQNQIAAMLGRARGEAIGMQKVFGLFFYIDPSTERINVAEITEAEAPITGSPAATLYLDLVGGSETTQLPPGVSVQLLDNATIVSGSRADDGYIAFNVASGTRLKYGGVILFDSNGRLISSTYGFRTADNSGAATQIGALFYDSATPPTFLDPCGAGNPPLRSQFGLVLFEREAFMNQGFTLSDPQVTNPGSVSAAYIAASPVGISEKMEEDWLDRNATALLINRYNGTIVRAE